MRMTKLIPLTIAATAALAGPAYAQTATEDAYRSMSIAVPPRSGAEAAASSNLPAGAPAATPTAKATPSVSSPNGGLPFTGLDLGIVVALAVGLTGLGFGLRRVTRTSAG